MAEEGNYARGKRMLEEQRIRKAREKMIAENEKAAREQSRVVEPGPTPTPAAPTPTPTPEEPFVMVWKENSLGTISKMKMKKSAAEKFVADPKNKATIH